MVEIDLINNIQTFDEEYTENQLRAFSSVGILMAHWNKAELFFSGIVSVLHGLGPKDSHLLTRHLGNVSLVKATLDVAHLKLSSDSEMIALVEHCCAFFDKCRTNRNLIVHSITSTEENQNLTLKNGPDHNRNKYRDFDCPIEAIQSVIFDVRQLETLSLETGLRCEDRNESILMHNGVDIFDEKQRTSIFELPTLLVESLSSSETP